MKGIAGVLYPDVFQVNQTIKPMLHCFQFGSNEKIGSHVFRNIELGTCGSPLCCNSNKTIYVSLCGFLDNSIKLQNELKKDGFEFLTYSDEEVILHGYQKWGKEVLSKITGSFVLAILDHQSESLIIGRDSVGKKTIYWFQDQNYFLFSNQLKSLLTTGIIPQTPDPAAIASYLYFGYCPQDMTPIKGVSKLLPGYYLELKCDGSKVIRNYWSYSSFFEKKYSSNEKIITEELSLNLKRALEVHANHQEPMNCYLSGGIGSASVAYYLTRLCNKENIKSVSCGFQGENDEDILAASDVAQDLGISQRRTMLTPKTFLADFVKIAWYLDEPLADPNVTATWNMARLAAEDSKWVFSGMGSDELFAGHNRYTINERGISAPSVLSRFFLPYLAQWLAPILNLFYKPAAYNLLKHTMADSWHIGYLNSRAVFTKKAINSASPKLAGLFDPEILLNKFYHLYRITSSTSAFTYFDVKTSLPDLYIAQYERLSSAFGLNWYSPYLNREVIEFAAGLPVPDDLSESESGVYIKKFLQNQLPDSVLNRPKKSRPHFLKSWLQQSNLPDLFMLLKNGTLVEEGFISPEWLFNVLSSPENIHNSFKQLWALLALETWFRIFINRSIEDTPPETSLYNLLMED